MHAVQPYLNDAWNFLHQGFNNVNAVKGLIIALVAAVMLTGWKRLWAMALGAAIVDIIVGIMSPVISNHAAFRLPPLLGVPFWRHALTLYVGYVIAIAVFFFVRANLLSGGGGAKKAAKHG
jgi:hypothetical protein